MLKLMTRCHSSHCIVNNFLNVRAVVNAQPAVDDGLTALQVAAEQEILMELIFFL
jgi:hypothetical protein